MSVISSHHSDLVVNPFVLPPEGIIEQLSFASLSSGNGTPMEPLHPLFVPEKMERAMVQIEVSPSENTIVIRGGTETEAVIKCIEANGWWFQERSFGSDMKRLLEVPVRRVKTISRSINSVVRKRLFYPCGVVNNPDLTYLIYFSQSSKLLTSAQKPTGSFKDIRMLGTLFIVRS